MTDRSATSGRTARRPGPRRPGSRAAGAIRLGAALALLWTAPATPDGARAGETGVPGAFVHRAPDGTTVFSDLPPGGGGAARTSYVGSYGRPPATVSCRGLDAAALDARGERLRARIERAARRHGVESALAMAVTRVESCFDPRARSVAGAEGLMQLMPATARALGVVDALSPEANLDGGARYLARMLRRFDGDETLALAAYNAGPGRVRRHGGVPPFPETIGYVRRVLAARERYRLVAVPGSAPAGP